MPPEVGPLRASGVRAEWAATPVELRAWVQRQLGSPVVSARTQIGGFSPGVAARLTCADGTRAFVKAVADTANPYSHEMLRSEAHVLAALPPSRLRPTAYGAYDDGGWAALLLEDVEGRMPDLPWSPVDLGRVLDALTDLGEELTPSPWPDAPRASGDNESIFAGWSTIAETVPDGMAGWVVENLDRLVELEGTLAAAVSSGETLCHIDVRSDNILLTEDRVVFVDWNWASVGPAWLDTLVLGWEVIVANGDLPAAVLHSPPVRGLDPALVTACVAGAAGMLHVACRRPPPPGLPTIRPWQRRYADALTSWLARRHGWR